MNKIIKYSNEILLAIILMVATGLRFSIMLWKRDFWYDEAFTGIITRMSWNEMWGMIFRDVHPPLYYYLLKPWASLFEYSVFGFRSFSVLFGVLSVLSIYFVGRKLFTKRVGLLAAFFMAISPFAILYSQEARMYALLGFLVIWLVYFFEKALRKNRLIDWMLWAVLCVLCIYTHYLAIFFVTVAGMIFIAYKMFFCEKGLKFIGRVKRLGTSWGFVLAVFVIGLAFSLWLPVFEQHTSRKGLGWVPIAYVGNIPSSLQVFFFGHPPSTTSIAKANEFREIPFSLGGEAAGNLLGDSSIGLVILILLIVGGVLLWRENKWRKEIFIVAGLSFGTLLLLIFLSQIGKRFYVDRYFIPVAVLVYLLFAVIVSRLKCKYQVMVVCFYVLLLLWLKPIEFDSSWGDILASRELVPQNTIIVADNAFEYTTARFHAGEGMVKLYNSGEPLQDFSMWIIVRPEDQIFKLDEYLRKKDVLFVGSWGYEWKGFDLSELKDVGRLNVYEK